MNGCWKKNELTFAAWHHGYLGLAFLLLGFVLGAGLGRIVFYGLGVILTVDDLVQHAIQIISQTNFKSPLKRLYGWFYVRIPALRSLNAWLDRCFSGKS